MAKKFYAPVSEYSKRVKKFYAPVNGISKKVKKGYCSVNGLSKLFYLFGHEYIIYDTGDFYNVPVGTDMSNYAMSGDSSAYLTNKCLWGKYQSRAEIWEEENDQYLRKLATVTNSTSSGWFIPVRRIYNPMSIKVNMKWLVTAGVSFNLWNYGVGYIDSDNTLNVLYKYGGQGASHRPTEWTDDEFDFSSHNLDYIDYVYIWGCDGSPAFRKISVIGQAKDIYSTLYPNANVYDAGTVSVNNGNRSPVSKNADGDAVVFCVRNGYGTGYGGNWMVTWCVARTPEAALIVAPNIGAGTSSYTVNGVTYYLGGQGSNAQWGGATEISSPIGVPIFDNWQLTTPNNVPTQAQFEEILQRLGITT